MEAGNFRTPAHRNNAPTRRKGRTLRPAPPDSVLMRLHNLVEKSRRSSVPLPGSFVRDEASDEDPPLARILRGGRGGEVRLKVLLTMHLQGARDPYDVPGVPGYWAVHLGLADENGFRRVRDAMNWLSENRFIRLERTRGKEPKCFLLSPLGDGQPYSRPTPALRYIRVPTAMWHNGWIVTLSGTALAMWLILAEMQGGRESQDVWVQPNEARERYALSDDTFTKGISELERHDLVRVSKQPQGAAEAHYNRLRNAYYLYGGRFHDKPGTEPTDSSRQPLSAAVVPRKRR